MEVIQTRLRSCRGLALEFDPCRPFSLPACVRGLVMGGGGGGGGTNYRVANSLHALNLHDCSQHLHSLSYRCNVPFPTKELEWRCLFYYAHTQNQHRQPYPTTSGWPHSTHMIDDHILPLVTTRWQTSKLVGINFTKYTMEEHLVLQLEQT